MAKTLYIAHTAFGHWSFTVPKTTPSGAIYAAENQVSTALLKSRGIALQSQDFGVWLRTNHPDIVAESHDYIGEVRQVTLLDDEPPTQFRKRYCNISFHDATARANTLGEELA